MFKLESGLMIKSLSLESECQLAGQTSRIFSIDYDEKEFKYKPGVRELYQKT